MPKFKGVYVLHPDSLIRETLTGAVSRLGHKCDSGAPDDVDFRKLPNVEVLFVDGQTLSDYAAQLPKVPKIVEIGSRVVRLGSKYPTLRVPFAMGELRKHLRVEES